MAGLPMVGGHWCPIGDHPSRATTTGTERQPVSPWPVYPRQEGSGVPSVTIRPEQPPRARRDNPSPSSW